MSNISQDFADAPPECRSCRIAGIMKITCKSNVNGNAGRPYYSCPKCEKFIVFADELGNCTGNPQCDCRLSSKRSVAGLDSSQPGRGFFSCRVGKCGFFKWDEEEEPIFIWPIDNK
ncbi:hypothetical protein F4806DRAFT_69859 [Annulohypoxylon nitens]|nr:hypothetical protein F4806DRAFT_69859 [Annulohypoxylon nitens]